MKRTLSPLWIAVATFTALCPLSVLRAQNVTNAAGVWNIINFTTPSRLTLETDTQGVVTGIPEAGHFDRSTGSLAVQSDGTFSGAVPDPISGSAALGDAGELVLNLDGTNGPPSLTFNLNQTADVITMAGSLSDGYQDFILGLRAPGTLTTNDLTGQWNISSFQTPYQLDLEFDSSNKLINVQGLGSFQTGTGNMTVNADGTFSGSAGNPMSGTVDSVGNGTVNVTVMTAEETNTFTLFINASKDLMAVVSAAHDTYDNFQELLLFTRVSSDVPPAALAADWRIASYDAPQLTQLKNGFGQVIGLDGLDGFGAQRQALFAGYDGFFIGLSGLPATGTFSGSSAGLVTATVQTPDGAEAIGFQLAGGGNAMVSSRTAGWGQELLLATRSWPAPHGFREYGLNLARATNSVTLQWVAATTNTALQVSTDSTNWTMMPETIGQHTYTTPATNRLPQLFRVAQPVP